MKKLSCLVLSLLLMMAFAGCTKSTLGLGEKANSAEPSASPSPSATATMDPSMVISHEQIEQMLSQASEATVTQEDIDYLLNFAIIVYNKIGRKYERRDAPRKKKRARQKVREGGGKPAQAGKWRPKCRKEKI